MKSRTRKSCWPKENRAIWNTGSILMYLPKCCATRVECWTKCQMLVLDFNFLRHGRLPLQKRIQSHSMTTLENKTKNHVIKTNVNKMNKIIINIYIFFLFLFISRSIKKARKSLPDQRKKIRRRALARPTPPNEQRKTRPRGSQGAPYRPPTLLKAWT